MAYGTPPTLRLINALYVQNVFFLYTYIGKIMAIPNPLIGRYTHFPSLHDYFSTHTLILVFEGYFALYLDLCEARPNDMAHECTSIPSSAGVCKWMNWIRWLNSIKRERSVHKEVQSCPFVICLRAWSTSVFYFVQLFSSLELFLESALDQILSPKQPHVIISTLQDSWW